MQALQEIQSNTILSVYPESYTEHIRDITLSREELYHEVSTNMNIDVKEVEIVMEGFIDHFLKEMKLK